MKRFIISLSLILISVFICIFTSKAIEKKADTLQQQLKQAAEIIETGNKDDINKALLTATEMWNDTENLFSFIVDADKIEQLSVDIPLLIVHINDDNKDYAMAKLRECDRLLEEITENERLHIKNVM